MKGFTKDGKFRPTGNSSGIASNQVGVNVDSAEGRSMINKTNKHASNFRLAKKLPVPLKATTEDEHIIKRLEPKELSLLASLTRGGVGTNLRELYRDLEREGLIKYHVAKYAGGTFSIKPTTLGRKIGKLIIPDISNILKQSEARMKK